MNSVALLVNRAVRSLSTMFPGYFGAAKHNHYKDFGFPENPQFAEFYALWRSRPPPTSSWPTRRRPTTTTPAASSWCGFVPPPTAT